MLIFVAAAAALTLDEAVRRAATVDPAVLIAEADTEVRRLEATEALTGQLLTPYATVNQTWRGTTSTTTSSIGVRSDVLDIGGWFDTMERSADATSARYDAEAARRNAQYVVATLYVAVLSADAEVEASRHAEAVATATRTTTEARVAAGLESELSARAARLGVLRAQAGSEAARLHAEVTRIALGRALDLEASGLQLDAAPAMDVSALTVDESPTVLAARARRSAAGWAHGQRVAELFPTGTLGASSAIDPMAWGVHAGLTWSFDGVIGPVLRERQAAADQRAADAEVDQVVRDAEAAVATALAQARSARTLAGLAQEEEKLAEASLSVGQARLAAGLSTTLEVLRLQDDAAIARTARLSAELTATTAALAARQAAGVAWSGP